MFGLCVRVGEWGLAWPEQIKVFSGYENYSLYKKIAISCLVSVVPEESAVESALLILPPPFSVSHPRSFKLDTLGL